MRSRSFLMSSVLCAWLCVSVGMGQQVTSDITGTIVDTSGATVPGAQITITNEATSVSREGVSDTTGSFHLINVPLGNYTVIVEAKGFKADQLKDVVVALGIVTNLAVRLELGEVRQTVVVTGEAATRVDTTSTEVGGTVTEKQIEALPIIGRNAMDLAQVEPGVQIREGTDIDPTKTNYTIVSQQGRSGRETQIEWDGLSIQDESVGGPVVNVSLDAIQEFQVGQANLNPSQNLASGGAVNIISRTGGKQYHGGGFGFFRSNKKLGSARVGPVAFPFNRQIAGGDVGGPILPNKPAFFFLTFEKNNTNDRFVGNPPGFPQFQKTFPKKFDEVFSLGRIDWTISPRVSAWVRFSDFYNSGVSGSPALGGPFLNAMDNRTQSNVFGSGFSLTGSRQTHSFRFGYLGFRENLTPASGIPIPTDSLGRPFELLIDGGSTLAIGPNLLTNQLEKQRTFQFKYDGAYILGRHTLRFGIDVTHWNTLGDFPLLINGPQVMTSSTAASSTNPVDFPLESVLLGNAQGFLTEKPILDFPHGGTFNTRPAPYFNDTWQAPHRLTVNMGVRYLHLSDIFNSDLKRDPLLDQFIPGLSSKTVNPALNFAPQLGLAWDPRGDGKTVIRSGAGFYFEEPTVDFNGTDRVPFFSPAIGLNFQFLAGGLPLVDPRTGQSFPSGDPLASSFGFPMGTSGAALAPLFGQPIGDVATQLNNLSLLFQAATAAAAQGGTALQAFRQISFTQNFTTSFTTHPKIPKVFQLNVGMERQLRPGLLLKAEYVKVRGIHFGLITDLNHVGRARSSDFSRNAALAAIAATNAGFGCPADSASSSIDCAIAKGATIASYGNNGLGEGQGFNGLAFRGDNPNFGIMDFLLPDQTSDYNAFNLSLQGRLGAVSRKGFAWVRGNTLLFTYTVSRKIGMVKAAGVGTLADQSNFPQPFDNDNPKRFTGPFSGDRTSMLNFASSTEIKGGFRIDQITHWWTPLPQNILIPIAQGGCDGGPSEIFCSDVTGDGSTGDLLPTAERPGSFGREVKGADGLNKAITAYNQLSAGQPTPAGQLLINENLFTLKQLQELGGVQPVLPLAPLNEVGLDPLVTTDLRIAWHHKFGEHFEVEPTIDIFNVFNRSNFDPPGNLLNGDLTGTPGHINGTTPGQRTNLRGRASGSFEQGANRQIQVGIRVKF